MSTTAPTNKPTPRRFSYTPRPYPVDERGFSPVDTALAKAYAREEMVTNDADGALNPYVLKVISAFTLIDWIRDDQKKIIGLKYFSSNLSGTHGVGYGQGKFSDANNGR